jgi:hypothetical protein
VRLLLIGFVAGCMALQMQAALVLAWQPMGMAAACLLCALALRRARKFPVLIPVLTVLAAASAGFGWSDWRAQQRLSVVLAPAWEGKDIIATRVVAELDRGLSFGGCSAGIACLGQVAPDSAATRFGDDMWKPGLELFPGVVFGPHWDMLDTYIPGLRDVIVQGVPEGSRLLAVDECTAVLGDGQRWRVQGSGTASLYDAGTWERFGPGAAFEAELRPSPA